MERDKPEYPRHVASMEERRWVHRRWLELMEQGLGSVDAERKANLDWVLEQDGEEKMKQRLITVPLTRHQIETIQQALQEVIERNDENKQAEKDCRETLDVLAIAIEDFLLFP